MFSLIKVKLNESTFIIRLKVIHALKASWLENPSTLSATHATEEKPDPPSHTLDINLIC